MKTDFQKQLARLLATAEQAADPLMNGLMDRTDYQLTVSELAAAIRKLREAYEQLSQERDDLVSRLNRDIAGKVAKKAHAGGSIRQMTIACSKPTGTPLAIVQ